MNNINWELMRPQDIEIRPAMVKDGNATLLLYQDSRNTMDALDLNFGAFGWQIKYKDVAGQIYGCLAIKDPNTNEWIEKWDTGDESNISAQKGQSSDILKRCAVRFGYGRELYTAPKIVIPDDGYGNTGYKVSQISYNEDRQIHSLTIVNRFGKEVFNWKQGQTAQQNTTPSMTKEAFGDYCKKLVEAGNNRDSVKSFYTFYTGPSKYNENKSIFETMKNFSPEKKWSDWVSKSS